MNSHTIDASPATGVWGGFLQELAHPIDEGGTASTFPWLWQQLPISYQVVVVSHVTTHFTGSSNLLQASLLGDVVGVTTGNFVPEKQPASEASGDGESGSFATDCVNDLCRWLDIPKRDLVRALGIPVSTFYSWRERGSRPRPRNTRFLFQIHGIVAIVVRKIGTREAREWFHAGHPRPIDILLTATANEQRVSQLAEQVQRKFAPQRNARPEVAASTSGVWIAPDTAPEGW